MSPRRERFGVARIALSRFSGEQFALVLVAELYRRRPAVGRRLIPDRKVGERRAPILQRIRALDVERVEARAQHEEQLLEQDLADGAQLALEAVALAQ